MSANTAEIVRVLDGNEDEILAKAIENHQFVYGVWTADSKRPGGEYLIHVRTDDGVKTVHGSDDLEPHVDMSNEDRDDADVARTINKAYDEIEKMHPLFQILDPTVEYAFFVGDQFNADLL